MRDCYSLASAGKGALLLDLRSGSIMELNESAAFIWNRNIAGEPPESIAAALAARYQIDLALAASHVNETLETSQEPPPPPPTDFSYEPTSSGYQFSFRGCPAFSIDSYGDEIALRPEAEPFLRDLDSLLHAVAPKLLALRGHVVLHAAAVEMGGQVFALSGVSEAGKSTTARALAEAGARLVCEDQLVLSLVDSRVMVPLAGEWMIQDWISNALTSLMHSGRSSCSSLDLAVGGQTHPLTEIGFLDKDRRTTGGYLSSELSAVSTAGAVFRHTFYGADSRDNWNRALRSATAIGSSVAGLDLSPPSGLERLREVARTLAAAGTLRA